MNKIVLSFVILLMCCTNGYCLMTGNDLLKSCSATVKLSDNIKLSAVEASNSSLCIGYLSGFTDSLQLSTHLSGVPVNNICLPSEGVSNEQLARVMAKWLKDHPEDLHKSVRIEVLNALSHVFPCK